MYIFAPLCGNEAVINVKYHTRVGVGGHMLHQQGEQQGGDGGDQLHVLVIAPLRYLLRLFSAVLIGHEETTPKFTASKKLSSVTPWAVLFPVRVRPYIEKQCTWRAAQPSRARSPSCGFTGRPALLRGKLYTLAYKVHRGDKEMV